MCKSYICSLNLYVFLNVFAVEAYAASWIEIKIDCFVDADEFVEAYAASWIEIVYKAEHLTVDEVEAYAASWIEIPIVFCGFTSRTVEAYAASWIEMYPTMPTARYPSGRGLRSLVD